MATTTTTTPVATTSRDERRLDGAALLFTIAVIVHNGDHVRRGASTLPRDVFWIGTAGILVEVALVVLICQRHRLAALAAAVGGIVLAAGYVEVHFLPAHRWLSDSFVSARHLSALSWTAASVEVVAAVALAITGALVHGAWPGRPRRLADAVLQPLALLMILSQLFMLAASLVQVYR